MEPSVVRQFSINIARNYAFAQDQTLNVCFRKHHKKQGKQNIWSHTHTHTRWHDNNSWDGGGTSTCTSFTYWACKSNLYCVYINSLHVEGVRHRVTGVWIIRPVTLVHRLRSKVASIGTAASRGMYSWLLWMTPKIHEIPSFSSFRLNNDSKIFLTPLWAAFHLVDSFCYLLGGFTVHAVMYTSHPPWQFHWTWIWNVRPSLSPPHFADLLHEQYTNRNVFEIGSFGQTKVGKPFRLSINRTGIFDTYTAQVYYTLCMCVCVPLQHHAVYLHTSEHM